MAGRRTASGGEPRTRGVGLVAALRRDTAREQPHDVLQSREVPIRPVPAIATARYQVPALEETVRRVF